MIELITAVLFLSLLLFIAHPFFRAPETGTLDPHGRSRLDELLNEKEEAYLSLKDLDLELRMGKLSREDYEVLKQESEARAIEILKQIEAVQASQAQAQRSPVKS